MDVFIVGGGPVGLAAAIALRQKGFQVTVADGQQAPIDKACGEGLLPEGVLAAERLGIRFDPVHTFRFRGIRFIGDGVSVCAEFRNGHGLGIRRTELHRALAARAEECGVELRWNFPVCDLANIHSRWIIGADGIGSRVRAQAGPNAVHLKSRRFGFRMHFEIAPWTDFVEVHWGEGCQIYVTPVARDQVGVAVLSRDPKLRVRGALRRFPAISKRLEAAHPASSERGGISSSCILRNVANVSTALIGDASGSVDAITGEGISLGFRQGFALAEAAEAGDLRIYERAHPELSRRVRRMEKLLLAMDRKPCLCRVALRILAETPGFFGTLLAIHTGAQLRLLPPFQAIQSRSERTGA